MNKIFVSDLVSQANPVVRLSFKVLMCLGLLFSLSSHAATIVVDGSDGTVADDGVCSLVEAITAANTDTASGATPGECIAGSGSDTIVLSQDVTIDVAAVLNEGSKGNTGLPYIDSNITLNGMGYVLQRNESLTCNNDGIADASEFRLLHTEDNGDLSIQDLILAHGCVDGNAVADRFFGGGIWNDGALSLENTVFTDNIAYTGAGIFNNGTISQISNSIFSDNVGSRNAGAIYNNFNSAITTITNSQFINNITLDREGGAFYIRGTVGTIEDSSFVNNQAVSSGGAIYNNGALNEVVNSTFSGNSSGSDGGAINNAETLGSINNSTFYNNSGRFGGAIQSSSHATTVNNSLFSGNSSNFSASADCYAASGSPNPPVFTSTNNVSNQNNQNCQLDMTTGLTTTTIDSLSDNGCIIPLADGSCVLTHALFIGSEALDAADVNTATLLDQRGYPIENNDRDVGAFEANVDLIFVDGFE